MSRTPPGWHTITPRIFVDNPPAFLEFLATVFQATGAFDGAAPAEVRIGDSVILVGGTSVRRAMPASLYVYVDDCDSVYGLAMAAGARSEEEPRNLPYGDRRATVTDAWGNLWQIATRN